MLIYFDYTEALCNIDLLERNFDWSQLLIF